MLLTFSRAEEGEVRGGHLWGVVFGEEDTFDYCIVLGIQKHHKTCLFPRKDYSTIKSWRHLFQPLISSKFAHQSPSPQEIKVLCPLSSWLNLGKIIGGIVLMKTFIAEQWLERCNFSHIFKSHCLDSVILLLVSSYLLSILEVTCGKFQIFWFKQIVLYWIKSWGEKWPKWLHKIRQWMEVNSC